MRRLSYYSAAACIGILASTTALASWGDYSQKLCSAESNCRLDATNDSSTATGKYQFTQGVLVDAGLYERDGSPSQSDFGGGEWSNGAWKDNEFGVKSREDFMKNEAAQEYVFKKYSKNNWDTMERLGTTKHLGKTVNGVKIDEASLLAGSHFLGAGGMHEYLENGTINGDALSNHPGAEQMLKDRMNKFAGTDVSEVTGSYTEVTGGSYAASSYDAPAATEVAGCDPDFAQHLVDRANIYIEKATEAAASEEVGYGEMEKPFGEQSCLENLMDGSADIFFEPPSIGNIAEMVKEAACNKAEELANSALEPLSDALSQTASFGGFSPIKGMNLISGGGVGVSFNKGASGSASDRINFNVKGSGEGVAAGAAREARETFKGLQDFYQ